MIRSLVLKLTLAFLIVSLTGAVLVAFIIHQSTRSAFDQFILDREQQLLVNILEQYYQSQGSWEGMEDYFRSGMYNPPRLSAERRETRRSWNRFTLIDADQTIVYSSLPSAIGRTYSSRDLNRLIPLEVNGKIVGWLDTNSNLSQIVRTTTENAFLERVNAAARLSAIMAAVLALVLGGLLAYTLTRSIRELTEATNDIARGNLGRQVKVRSRDEMGDLASSFNKMSQDLARATQMRRQMTADIAHDLRSPLSVISGYTEALSDGKLCGSPEIYEILYQETLYLKRLIDDLRELSLADSGELPLCLQPVQPRALLEQAATRQAVAAQQKEISLRLEDMPDIPLIQADYERLAQVLDNLINNALRYTPAQGEIILSARVAGDHVQMHVQDSGSGISPEDLPHIFDRFYRGDKSRQGNGESGLGLAIARSLVEAHGGTISAKSQPGQGTIFTISLPREHPERL